MIIASTTFYFNISPHWQSQLLVMTQYCSLPVTKYQDVECMGGTKLLLPDALHVRRSTEMIPTKTMNCLIPIPPKQEFPSEPGLTTVRHAWWDAIKLIYSTPYNPLNVSLELRIIGDSRVLLPPQYGNTHGTASIEVVSIANTSFKTRWRRFCQALANIWTSYEVQGKRLNVRSIEPKSGTGLS